jgi:hypothetical protein
MDRFDVLGDIQRQLQALRASGDGEFVVQLGLDQQDALADAIAQPFMGGTERVVGIEVERVKQEDLVKVYRKS